MTVSIQCSAVALTFLQTITLSNASTTTYWPVCGGPHPTTPRHHAAPPARLVVGRFDFFSLFCLPGGPIPARTSWVLASLPSPCSPLSPPRSPSVDPLPPAPRSQFTSGYNGCSPRWRILVSLRCLLPFCGFYCLDPRPRTGRLLFLGFFSAKFGLSPLQLASFRFPARRNLRYSFAVAVASDGLPGSTNFLSLVTCWSPTTQPFSRLGLSASTAFGPGIHNWAKGPKSPSCFYSGMKKSTG